MISYVPDSQFTFGILGLKIGDAVLEMVSLVSEAGVSADRRGIVSASTLSA